MGSMGREETAAGGAHVVLLPFPAQGHMNPMVELGKRLAARGLPATLALTRFVSRSMPPPEKSTTGAMRVVGSISDGHDDGGFAVAESFRSYMDAFKAEGSRTLAELIGEEAAQGRPVRAVVYDSHLPWAVDVAKGMGLLAASLFTQACAVNAAYHHAYLGRLSLPPPASSAVSIEGMPALRLDEMPSFIARPWEDPEFLELAMNQYLNLEKADAVLVNTFDRLEPQATEWMSSVFPTKTIGPTTPTMYPRSRDKEDEQYGLHISAAPQRSAYREWLDAQEELASVVYVSFGSVVDVSGEQMAEVAWGLVASGNKFLWVVREAEEGKLPEGFATEVAGKGLVVRWCAQQEVLAHPAVGCFVSHCGWNSTLEAMSLGMPMVALPQWADQPTNAKYVEEMWGTGVRARVTGDDGVVSREELRSRIGEVMEGEKAEDIRRNARMWRKLAAEAAADGGSSDRNLWEFVRMVNGQNLPTN